jgi:hypothetical protein
VIIHFWHKHRAMALTLRSGMRKRPGRACDLRRLPEHVRPWNAMHARSAPPRLPHE